MRTTVSSGIRSTCLSALITFCVTASTNAVAQNNIGSAERYADISDAECTTLYNDSTLNEQNVTRRIACHQRSVNRIDWLVNQLQSERSILTSKLREDDPLLLEYKQKLINNKKTVERLEQRTTDLASLSDALRIQRDEYRKRLFSVLKEAEASDQSRELDDRLFRNFSQSYVSLSNENNELRRLLDEQKQSILGNQSEISSQQSVIQQLQNNLASSSDQIEATSQSNQLITEELQEKNRQLQSIKQRLLDTALAEQKQQEQTLQLTRELALTKEAQEQSINDHRETNKTASLQIDALNSKIQALEQKNKTLIDTVANMQDQHEKKSQSAKVTESNLKAEKIQLEGRLEQSKAQLALVSKQQTELMQQVDGSRTKLLEFDQSNAELVQKIEKIEDRNTKLHTELDDIEEQLRNTETQLSEAQEQRQSLQEQLLLANNQNEELNNAMATREQTFGALQLKSDTIFKRFKSDALGNHLTIKRLEEQNAQLSTKLRQHNTKAQETESALTAALAESEAKLDTTVSSQEALNQEHKARVDILKERLATRDQRVVELRTQQIQLNKQLESVQLESEANRAEIGNQLNTREQKIAELETETAKLADELAAAMVLADEYSEQLASQTEASANEIAVLQNNAGKDRQSIEQLTEQAGKLKEELATALSTLEKDAEALAAAEQSKSEFRQTSEATLNRLKAQALEDKQHIARLDEQLAQLDSSYKQASEKLNALESVQQSNDTLTTELATASLQLSEQISNNKMLGTKISDSDSLVSNLESKLALTESDTEKLVVALQQKDEQIDTKQAQIDDMEAVLSNAEEEKNKLTRQVTALETDLTNLNELLLQSQSDLASSLEQMRIELRASDERLASRKSALTALMNEKQANADALAQYKDASTLLSESIRSKLSEAGLSDASVELQNDQTIAISVGSNTLFRAGSSQLTEEGSSVLATVGNSIADIDNRKIVVEGHSDNTPLGARLEKRFVDNWGLSMARAVSTANFLTRNTGIPANLLSVSGLGDTDPVADNSTVEGRQQNRRVEILLVDDRNL